MTDPKSRPAQDLFIAISTALLDEVAEFVRSYPHVDVYAWLDNNGARSGSGQSAFHIDVGPSVLHVLETATDVNLETLGTLHAADENARWQEADRPPRRIVLAPEEGSDIARDNRGPFTPAELARRTLAPLFQPFTG